MRALDSAVLRVPVAVILGSIVFAVGFVRLVALSTRFTTHVLRGESPDDILSRLQHEREHRHRAKSKSPPPP
jgi:hypothetical protein